MTQNIDMAALVAGAGDAVVACNAGGEIILWNAAAERIFGYTAAEALGQSLDLIIPERLRQRHWDGYNKTMETGITKYGADLLRVPATDKAGKAMSIAFTVSMLLTPENKVDAIVSIIRDETGRFNEDRAMRKRMAELEAQLASADRSPN